MTRKVACLQVVCAVVLLGACDQDGPEAGPSCAHDCESDASVQDASADARIDARDGSVRPDAAADAALEGANRDAGTHDGGRDAAPGDAGANPGDPYASLRELCVDTINMYRATKSLPPLMRASASEEACSDEGAEFDHMRGRAHGSAAANAIPCRRRGVAQNSCPDYGHGGRRGGIDQALTSCLKQMWDEGEPPGGVDACLQAYFDGDTACFLAHGHYINMIADKTAVSCGFYDTGEGEVWMNQDF